VDRQPYPTHRSGKVAKTGPKEHGATLLKFGDLPIGFGQKLVGLSNLFNKRLSLSAKAGAFLGAPDGADYVFLHQAD
jgi:hypothetical protein